MGFEYQRERPGDRLRNTYTDDLITSIFHTKDNLKIDVEKELDVLRNLKVDIEKQLEQAEQKRKSIIDWDSSEYEEVDDLCFDLNEKISVLEDWIDYFEGLSEKL